MQYPGLVAEIGQGNLVYDSLHSSHGHHQPFEEEDRHILRIGTGMVEEVGNGTGTVAEEGIGSGMLTEYGMV